MTKPQKKLLKATLCMIIVVFTITGCTKALTTSKAAELTKEFFENNNPYIIDTLVIQIRDLQIRNNVAVARYSAIILGQVVETGQVLFGNNDNWKVVEVQSD